MVFIVVIDNLTTDASGKRSTQDDQAVALIGLLSYKDGIRGVHRDIDVANIRQIGIDLLDGQSVRGIQRCIRIRDDIDVIGQGTGDDRGVGRIAQCVHCVDLEMDEMNEGGKKYFPLTYLSICVE